jgi:hypothetical protein
MLTAERIFMLEEVPDEMRQVEESLCIHYRSESIPSVMWKEHCHISVASKAFRPWC